MAVNKIRITLEFDEREAVKNPGLSTMVQQEVKKFVGEMEQWGLKGNAEWIEEVIKNF